MDVNLGSISGSRASRKFQVRGGESFSRLYQVLYAWDNRPYPRFLTILGVFLETVQLLALVIGPMFSFNYNVVKELSYVVFFFNVPLWEQHFWEIPLAVNLGVIGVLFLVLVGIAGTFVGFMTKSIEQGARFIDRATHAIYEIAGGCLFLPLLHLFLSPMMCGGYNTVMQENSNSNDSLTNFPDESCYGGLHVISLVVGLLGSLILLAVALIVRVSISDPLPASTHLRARAHNYVDGFQVLAKFLVAVLFHVLLPRGQYAAYSVLTIIIVLPLFIFHCYTMPYFADGMNQLHGATYTVIIFGCLVHTSSSFMKDSFVKYHLNSFIFICFVPFAALFGWLLAVSRRSGEYERRIHQLKESASISRHLAKYPFPKGVLRHDRQLLPTKYKMLESDILTEDDAQMEEEWEAVILSNSEIMTTYIDRVYAPTDVELSTRFLQGFKLVTSRAPTGNLLAFSARTYLKSLLLFKRSGLVKYHFAMFLFHFANRLNTALDMLEELIQQTDGEHNAILQYAAFKLNVKVKALFGVRDTAHLQSLHRAKSHHKEALQDMVLFWQKLMESKGDIIGLTVVSNTLTEKRELAKMEYERALSSQKDDRLLLTLYAYFLQHVLLNDAAAEEFKELAEAAIEEKKNRIMRGSKAKSIASGGKTNLMVHNNYVEEEEETKRGGSITNVLISVLFVIMFVIALSSIALFSVQLARLMTEETMLHNVDTAGKVRAKMQETVALSISVEREKTKCEASICEEKTFVQALQDLSVSGMELRYLHNLGSYGENGPRWGSGEGADYMTTTIAIIHEGEMTKSGLNPPSIFTANKGVDAKTQFIDAATDPQSFVLSPWTMVHFLSYNLADFINKLLVGTEYDIPLQLITGLNGNSAFLHTMSSYITLRVKDIESVSNQLAYSTLGILIFAVIALVFAYLSFFSNLHRVGAMKATVIKLFTLIPYPTQEQLCNTTKQWLEQFERVHDENDDMGLNRDAEDDAALLEAAGPAEGTPTQETVKLPSFSPAQRHSSTEPQQQQQQQRAVSPSGRGKSSQLDGSDLALSTEGRKKSKSFDTEDEIRRASRFFGIGRKHKEDMGPKPILKRGATPTGAASAAQHRTKAHTGLRGKGKRKRVMFTIDGEKYIPGTTKAEEKRPKLKEPSIMLGMRKQELLLDLEKSLKAVEEEEKEEITKMKVKQEMVTDKMIQSGTHSRMTKHKRSHMEQVVEKESLTETFISAFVFPALVVACFVCSLIAVQKGNSTLDDYNEFIKKEESISQLLTNVDQMVMFSHEFCNFGRTESYQAFFDLLGTEKDLQVLEELEADPFSKVEFKQNIAVTTLQGERMLATKLSVMALSARGQLTTQQLLEMPFLATVTWDDTEITYKWGARYPTAFDDPDPSWLAKYLLPSLGVLSNYEKNASDPNSVGTLSATFVADVAAGLTKDDLLTLARNALYSNWLESDREQVRQSIETPKQTYRSDATAMLDNNVSQLTSLFVAVIICAVLALFVGTFRMWRLYRNDQGSSLTLRVILGYILTAGAIVACILMIIFAAIPLSELDEAKNNLNDFNSVARAIDELQVAFMDRFIYTSTFVNTGSNKTVYDIHHTLTDVAEAYQVFASRLSKLYSSFDPSQGLKDIVLAEQVQNVGMYIKQRQVTGKIPDPQLFLASYDFSLEPNAVLDKSRYSNDRPQLQYTSSTQDFSGIHSDKELGDMARHAMLGRRGSTRIQSAFSSAVLSPKEIVFSSAYEAVIQRMEDEISKTRVLMIISIVAVCSLFIEFFVIPLYEFLFKNRSANKHTEAMMDTLFASVSRKCRISLMIVAIILILQFVFIALTWGTGKRGGEVMDAAHLRTFYVSRSVILAHKILAASEKHDYLLMEQMKKKLVGTITKMENARNQLYFSTTATSSRYGSVKSLSDKQRQITFGDQGTVDPLDRQYLRWIEMLTNFAEVPGELALPTTINDFPLTARIMISQETTRAKMMALVTSMEAAAVSLKAKLEESNAVHMDDILSTLHTATTPDAIFLVAMLIVLALELQFIFRPMANEMQQEEQGARLMLQMIPNEVREIVPKISLFLSTGVLTEEEQDAKTYQRCSTVEKFLKAWQTGNTDQHCFAILLSSPLAMVVIDSRGCIVHASGVQQLLGYEPSDLVGCNVSMLCDEPIRSMHDSFISRFLEQGTSRVIGSGRDVLAVMKNGEHQHVFMYVTEAVRDTGATYFIAQLERFRSVDVKKEESDS